MGPLTSLVPLVAFTPLLYNLGCLLHNQNVQKNLLRGIHHYKISKMPFKGEIIKIKKETYTSVVTPMLVGGTIMPMASIHRFEEISYHIVPPEKSLSDLPVIKLSDSISGKYDDVKIKECFLKYGLITEEDCSYNIKPFTQNNNCFIEKKW